MTRWARWTLVVSDVNGRSLYERSYFFRRSATKYGEAVITPPLNSFTVRRVGQET